MTTNNNATCGPFQDWPRWRRSRWWQRRRRRLSALTMLFLLLYLVEDDESSSSSPSLVAASPPFPPGPGGLTNKVLRMMFGVSRSELLRVCYGRYGCFSLDYPWVSTRRLAYMAPKSPHFIWPKFLLYTRRPGATAVTDEQLLQLKRPPQQEEVLLENNAAMLRRSRFRKDRMTFVITHGFMEHGRKDWLQEMKDELLKNGDHNVIVVDWLTASRPPYTQAVANIRMIGVQIAHFLAFMAKEAQLDLMHVHMVGHSLGAHLAGHVGEYLQNKMGTTLGRITGLDPAEPHFELGDEVTRLDPSDAFFVDVIHTDAGPIMSGGAGMWQPCGHLDFYPNGGVMMKGCDRTISNSLQQEDGNLAFAFRRLIGCNHYRAYEYFTESINGDCPFTGVECSSYEAFTNGQCDGCLMSEEFRGCEYMGFKAFSSMNGSRPEKEYRRFYLLTEAKKPFCSWPFRVQIVLSDTPEGKRQGGDRGNFYMVLHGEEGSTARLRLNPEETYFESSRVYNFVTTTRGVGHIHAADLIWEYAYHLLNPLTWRLFSGSKMFVNRVEIEKFGGGKRHVFCAQDRPFFPGRPQRVIWRPTCRENNPDPGATFLGTVLNADPIGGAEMVLHQVNPLAMNPLNGLSTLSNAFTSFTSGVQSMSATIRRMGSDVRRAMIVDKDDQV